MLEISDELNIDCATVKNHLECNNINIRKTGAQGFKNGHAKKIEIITPSGDIIFCYGDFKKKLIDINNGNSGLYDYLQRKLRGLKIPKRSKYNEWNIKYLTGLK